MERATYAELFAKSLEAATHESGIYRCPLCLTAFGIEAADDLTWDHYPPQSIGGQDRDVVLVCSACQRSWSEIDAELVPFLRREAFDRSHPDAHPIVLRIADHPQVRGLRHREGLSVRDGVFTLLGRPEANHEAATQRLTEFMDSAVSEQFSEDLTFTFSTDPAMVFSRSRIERILLKAAYLAAFDCFGYPFILAPALQTVKEQMANPRADIVGGHTLAVSPQPLSCNPAILMAHVSEPVALFGLVVFFIGYRLDRAWVTLLPVPTHPEGPCYGKLDAAVHEAKRLDLVWFERSRKLACDTEVILVDEGGREWPVYPEG